MKYTAEELQQCFVDGFLFLEGSDIEELPEGLVVERDADLRDCLNLTELPKGFTVKGDLTLRGCTYLTTLPEGLTVGGFLDLDGCKNLVGLPKGLKVGTWLNICHTGLSQARVPEDAQIGTEIYYGDIIFEREPHEYI